MWDYSETVKEHFFNPRNAGAVSDANAVGEVGSLSCGDALRLTLKVDPHSETILEAGFQTFGCGSAIASSSALTEIIRGMTLDAALQVSNQEIAEFLDGLPPEKMHCSVMGREALQAAIADYRGEVWQDDHSDGALVCRCFAVEAPLIEQTIRANGLTRVEQVTHYTKAGGGCSACHEGIEEILTRVLAESGRASSPATAASAPASTQIAAGMPAAPQPPDSARAQAPAAAPAAEPAPATASSGSGTLARIRRIEQTIEAIRPALQRDRGDVELIDVDGRNVLVKMSGACTGCQLAAVTLEGIQQRLCEDLGELVRVVPAR